MKVKVLKDFVSGKDSGSAGDLLELPFSKAERLIHIGFVAAETASVTPETPVKPAAKTPAKKKAAK